MARGRGLALHLDRLYEAIEGRIATRRVEFDVAPDDTVREDAIVEMRSLLWFVRDLQSNLGWLDAAQTSPLDLGTSYFVESTARALVTEEVEVTVVAADHISYATTSNPWEPLIASWSTTAPSSGPTVVVIFIPRREEHSGLLHPLIVHELGHAADSQHDLVDEIWATAQARSRFRSRFSKAVSELASSEGTDPAVASSHIADRLRSWIAESLCDSIAVHHLGPTYLYSFLAEVAAGSMDEAGPKHPPSRQRVRLIVDNLDRLGWTQIMHDGDAMLETWVRETIATKPAYTGVERFLTWAIDELRAVVRAQTKRLVGKQLFVPDLDELAEVESLLGMNIPPAQRSSGRAVSRQSIMLACWHAALAGASYGPKALPDAADAPELADVLPAALELSALTDAWNTR
jgi:hypothetical protein